jgi:hypothetical protein
MAAHGGDDVVGDVALVVRIDAVRGDLAQRGREFRIVDRRADRLGLALRVEEVGAGRRLVGEAWSSPASLWKRGVTGKPFSASAIAGPKRSFQGSLP